MTSLDVPISPEGRDKCSPLSPNLPVERKMARLALRRKGSFAIEHYDASPKVIDEDTPVRPPNKALALRRGGSFAIEHYSYDVADV